MDASKPGRQVNMAIRLIEHFCEDCGLSLKPSKFHPRDLAAGKHVCRRCKQWRNSVAQARRFAKKRGTSWVEQQIKNHQRLAAVYEALLKEVG